MSLFPDSRAVVIGLPQSFDLLHELAHADTIRLGTAFAHQSGWEILAPAISDSRAEVFLLTGTSLFQTEPKVLREWLRLSMSAKVKAKLYAKKRVTFHPKVLVVEGKTTFAIVGSGNLSRGGLCGNVECGVFVGEGLLLAELLCWFDTVFSEAKPLRDAVVMDYERKWGLLRKLQKGLYVKEQNLEDEFETKTAAVMKY